MNKKKAISMTSLAALAIVTIFIISPYFYDVTVDEALPTASAESPAGKFVGSKILICVDCGSTVVFQNQQSILCKDCGNVEYFSN